MTPEQARNHPYNPDHIEGNLQFAGEEYPLFFLDAAMRLQNLLLVSGYPQELSYCFQKVVEMCAETVPSQNE